MSESADHNKGDLQNPEKEKVDGKTDDAMRWLQYRQSHPIDFEQELENLKKSNESPMSHQDRIL